MSDNLLLGDQKMMFYFWKSFSFLPANKLSDVNKTYIDNGQKFELGIWLRKNFQLKVFVLENPTKQNLKHFLLWLNKNTDEPAYNKMNECKIV